METWNVTVVFAGAIDEDTFVAGGIVDDLDALDGSPANAPRGRYTISLWRDADNPLDAQREVIEIALRIARKYGLGEQIVAMETATEEELDARYPDLVSGPEAAEILGVSRQRVHTLAAEHPDFPEPPYRMRAGALWTRASIETFARRWDRRSGPRRKAS